MVLEIISPWLYLREDTESGQDNRTSLPKCYSLKNVLSASLPAMVVALYWKTAEPRGNTAWLVRGGHTMEVHNGRSEMTCYYNMEYLRPG